MRDGELFIFQEEGQHKIGSYCQCDQCQIHLYADSTSYSSDGLGTVPSLIDPVKKALYLNGKWFCPECFENPI